MVTSGCSVSSGFGDDEIVSNSNETMSNPAMTAPIIMTAVVQLACHGKLGTATPSSDYGGIHGHSVVEKSQ
jgi:hypothetical protein